MFVVGLTGGIGSGKSTVAGKFEQLGVDLIDADDIAREVVEPGTDALAEIVEHFGTGILTSSGESHHSLDRSLDRKKLRGIVFEDPAARQWLESLLHPLIANSIQRRIANSTSPYCILESPLLLETTQAHMVQRLLVVDVAETTQLRRTMLRDESSEKTVLAIIAAQSPREQRLEAADDVLDNELPLQTLDARISDLHRIYLSLSSAHDVQ